MTALEDTRPIATTTTASTHPSAIGSDLAQLLLEHPDLELASIRLVPRDDNGGVLIVGRVGQLAEPECSSCHTHDGHPHTEYCQLVDHASQLTHLELYGPIEGPHYEQRPADDPADEITCDGRNCGGYPHA